MATRGHDTKERILRAAQALVLEKGFSATSVDNIIQATGVTKGAFFHHFKSKADLARQLIERFAKLDFALFEEWDRRADALSDDPYQALIIFLKLFEEWLGNLRQPFAGCLFAVYVYESNLFEPEINDYVNKSLEHWQRFYQRKFEAIIAERPPKLDVSAAELAESIIAILEGAFILARSGKQPDLIARQSRLFRGYVKLLFDEDGHHAVA